MNITLTQARQAGYKKLFFTWTGLGDSVVFLKAICEYHKHFKEKVLIVTYYPFLFNGLPFVDILQDILLEDEKSFVILQQYGIEPIFCSTLRFRFLAPSFKSNVFLWPDKHMVTAVCESMGISGTVNIAPKIHLSDEEKQIGKISDKQICIISQGLQKYKTWPLDKTCKLVEKNHKQYDFIQLGLTSDPPLPHVLDMRGKLTLSEVASYLYNSKLFVGPQGGLMHLARAVNCHSVIIASAGEPVNCSLYQGNIFVTPKTSCSLCSRNLRDPQHQPCFFNYSCIKNIQEEDVSSALNAFMQNGQYSLPFPKQEETAHASEEIGLRAWNLQKYRKQGFYGRTK